MLDTGINWERIFWRTVPQKGTCGCWSAAAPYESAVCALVVQGLLIPHSGVHQKGHPQPDKRGDYPTVFSADVTSS